MNEILLVDDNAGDVELTLRALRGSNIANGVVVVRDGVQALDYLFATGRYVMRDDAPLPQMMLLDLDLPRIDGLQVLQRMRANPATRLLPVILMSSSVEQRDQVSGGGFGVECCILKPVDVRELVDAVRQLGLSWWLLNQPPPALAGACE
jgi:two-component system response regulator